MLPTAFNPHLIVCNMHDVSWRGFIPLPADYYAAVHVKTSIKGFLIRDRVRWRGPAMGIG